MPGFEEWYREQHAGLVTAFILVTGDVDVARDVVAEACSRALEKWEDVQEMANPAGWTYTVALNLLRRNWRKRARERDTSLDRLPPGWTDLPEMKHDVLRAVRGLPDRARLAVVLRYFADLPEQEVATAMGVALGTASATLATARRRLADVLADYVDAGELL